MLSRSKRQGFPGGSVVKNPPATAADAGDAGSALAWEDALEEEMATHSSILAWEIPTHSRILARLLAGQREGPGPVPG